MAVAPVIEKSSPSSSTFSTSSLKVTRQVRLSASVGELVGTCRSIEVTRSNVFGMAKIVSGEDGLWLGCPAQATLRRTLEYVGRSGAILQSVDHQRTFMVGLFTTVLVSE